MRFPHFSDCLVFRFKEFEPPRREGRKGLVLGFPRSGKTIREKANGLAGNGFDIIHKYNFEPLRIPGFNALLELFELGNHSRLGGE
jgi:hypothetical protein